MGNPEPASGKRPEMEQLVQQKGGESCLLLHWSPGAPGQAEQCCCMTQPCIPNEPLLHETPWFSLVSEQNACPLDTKETNSAVPCWWPTLPHESPALTWNQSQE